MILSRVRVSLDLGEEWSKLSHDSEFIRISGHRPHPEQLSQNVTEVCKAPQGISRAAKLNNQYSRQVFLVLLKLECESPAMEMRRTCQKIGIQISCLPNEERCKETESCFRSSRFAEGEKSRRKHSYRYGSKVCDSQVGKMKMVITWWELFSEFFFHVLGFTPLDFVLLCPFDPGSLSVCGPSQ